MEQDILHKSTLGPGMYGSDRDLFERVWRRVMPEDRPDSPIELEKGEPATKCEPTPIDRNRSTLLGMIDDEMTDAVDYRQLAYRFGGQPATVFTPLSAEEQTHAKRLCNAFFLLTGTRYFSRAACRPNQRELLQTVLRRRIEAETNGAAHYKAAATETTVDSLRSLYLDLAADELRHSETLRRLLSSW